MARIPQYDPSVQLTHLGPGIEQDIQSFGVEGRARAKYLEEAGRTEALGHLVSGKSWGELGDFGEKLGSAGLALNQALHQAKQLTDLTGMKMDATQRLFELREEVKAEPDPAQWPAKYREAAGKLFEETVGRSADPQVQAHFKTTWASHFPVMLQKVSAESRKQQAANFAGNLEENYGRAIDLYVQAGSDVERAKIQGEAFALLNGGVTAGLLAPAKAQQLRAGFETAAALGIINKAKLTDPAGTLAKIKEPGAFGLDDTQRAKLIPDLTANLHRAQQDHALQVQKWYESKQLTPENLMAMRDAQVINLSTWKFYDAALQADRAPVPAQQDLDLYIPLWKQAQQGKMNPEQVYEGRRAGRLTNQDAHFLIRTNEAAAQGQTPKDQAFNKDPYFRLAAREIEDRLRPLEKMRGLTGMQPGAKTPSPTNEAAFLFLEACREAQEKGELTGPWMWKKAQEIIQPFELMGMKGVRPGATAPAPAPGVTPEMREKALEILRQRGRLP